MYSNAASLAPSKTAEERKVIIETASKQESELNNPCVQEQKLSYKCLTENNFDKDKCANVFKNYTKCQQFWSKIQAIRKGNGTRPYLPRPEEREKIKNEYLENLRKQ